MPKVTVITPCWNSAVWIGKAAESLFDQTFRDFEWVVVDDASDDNSVNTVLRYRVGMGFPTAVLALWHNVGPVRATTLAVNMTDSEYILILDSDGDYITPDYLEKTVPILDADARLGFVYTDTTYFGDTDKRHFQPEYDFSKLLCNNFISYCSLIRRRAWIESGGYDLKNWGYFYDWQLWIRLGLAGWYGKHLPEPLFFYRQHFSDSLCNYIPRLEPAIKAYIYSRNPNKYSPQFIEECLDILKAMPEGWHTRPPDKTQ
jgi:glycosyltransferase involved in cell wall biosynthesis